MHAHYANMYVPICIPSVDRSVDKPSRGGFSIRFRENTRPEPQAQPDSGEAALKYSTNQDTSKQPYQSLPLFAEQVSMLVEEFSVEIPHVTREDIKDRSKSDTFTKLFAIGQSTWLIVQCIARAGQGLRE